jgi:hypothetical protein
VFDCGIEASIEKTSYLSGTSGFVGIDSLKETHLCTDAQIIKKLLVGFEVF